MKAREPPDLGMLVRHASPPRLKLSIDHCPRCSKPCRFAGFAWVGEYRERRAAEFLCIHCGGWFQVEVEQVAGLRKLVP